ncbi:hypothetical protein [Dokdonella sp.]|uniref:hypothetical protein n=1 Tax=Dokdonella sp. TaxID=2291710 RepID=UPI003C3F5E39
MIKTLKHPCFLLVAVAASLAGCGSSDNPASASGAASPNAISEPMPVSTPAPATVEVVSRERVLRAMRCQIVLSQSIGVAMANADTGLPPDLVSRLKVSAVARWQDFTEAHAEAAGVQASDRAEIVVQSNSLSSTDEDRQRTIDIVRDCLDSQP